MRTNVIVMGVEIPEELLKTVSSVTESVIEELRPKDKRQINVVLTNDRVIHKLNREFRKIDKPTDVLSFVYEDEDLVGEIVISLETVECQAQEYGHSYMYELIFNLIHGVLHLCGYNHEDPKEEQTMMELQEVLMKKHFFRRREREMRVKPFKAVRPKRELAEKVACPPYDVVSEDDVLRLTKGNPYSFLHVVRAEVARKPRLDPSDPTVHVRARDTLNRFLNEGILIQDDSPRFYVYAQQMGEHRQVGLVACASVEEYLEGKIKKHELTRQDKEDDRTCHVLTVGANTGPVFLMYRSIPELDTLIMMSTKEIPEYDFVDENGVRHTVWMVTDDSLIRKIEDWFSRRVKELYIADGHHRAAAAARACQKLKAENPHHAGDEEYNFFLSVIFPHNQLMILPYNRVVKDLNDLSVHEFLEKTSAHFEVEKLDVETFEPQQRHVFGMYMKERWYRLEPREGSFDPSDPVDSLDVQILLKNLLQPVLGIENPRKDPRIDFVGGIKGVEYLKELVDSGKYSVAFSLYPTQIEDLIRVADAGMIMPPKSTWFEPKLRSGLFVHRIE